VFLDARGVAAGSEVACEVCIVGAGAAGIAIARELTGSDARVVLLESGGFHTDARTQRLYEGDVVGHSYAALAEARVRAFGGSTGHWQGWCRPLDDADFAERRWVPGSGWPLRTRELEPYYRRAQVLCELGPYDYRPEFWSRLTGQAPLPLNESRVEQVVYQFSPPTHFGVVYRNDVRASANVRAFLHANAVRLVRSGGRSIGRVDVATLTGRRFAVKASHFVLATGGIENARLLLASNVGNDNDLVGRFFAEHPHASAALVLLPKSLPVQSFYSASDTSLGRVRGAWATPRTLEQDREILRLAATLDRVEDDPFVPQSAEDERARDFSQDIAAVARSLDQGDAHELFALFVRMEQSPNPDSRVLLGDETDALGVPKVRLDWRLNDLDRRSLREALASFAAAVGEARLGRLYSRPTVERDFWPDVFGGMHHMGTTRMHRDARLGVVDRDCRVHGLENLYVAGSSVFPTSGYANPTLTIVALSLRLADHLRRRIA
jgi:choline dehydrogenase-like flavoprotein